MITATYVGEALAIKALREFADRDLKYAALQTLNQLAFGMRGAWEKRAGERFDRPVPLTRRAALYTKANIDNLTARIFIRDEAFKGTPPSRYLLPQVKGGARRQKPIERRLAAQGLIGANEFVVPGAGVKLNTYGNISAGLYQRILSRLGAQFDRYQNTPRRSPKRRGSGADYFALRDRRGRLPRGIYQRFASGAGSTVKPVLLFVSRAMYRPRYDVFDVGRDYFNENYNRLFEENYRRAVEATAARNARR